jgi:hypothetical protein
MLTKADLSALDAKIEVDFNSYYDNTALANVAHWKLPNCAPTFNGDEYVDFMLEHAKEYAERFGAAIDALDKASASLR